MKRKGRKARMEKREETLEYFIVNSDVQMSPCKTAAQGAHVATLLAVELSGQPVFDQWLANDQKKIVLRGKEKELLKLIDAGARFIRDNGLTEIPKNTLTCVGLPPMTREEAKPFVKRLQLLH